MSMNNPLADRLRDLESRVPKKDRIADPRLCMKCRTTLQVPLLAVLLIVLLIEVAIIAAHVAGWRFISPAETRLLESAQAKAARSDATAVPSSRN